MDKYAVYSGKGLQLDVLRLGKPQPGSSEKHFIFRPRRTARKNRAAAVMMVMLLIAVIGLMIAQFDYDLKKYRHNQAANLVFPATLDSRITGEEWQSPVDVAIVDSDAYAVDPKTNNLYSVDFANNRVKKLVLPNKLSSPTAIDIYKSTLFTADSGAGHITAIADGEVENIAVPAASAPARPVGVHVTDNGDLLVTDANNNRVLQLSLDGSLLHTVGTGKRDNSNYGFNIPGGITTDRHGNIYVVDTRNARVQKFSPSWRYIATFGKSGDATGTLTRPNSVAVDDSGNVYISDESRAIVSVFSPNGKYQGCIGRKKPDDKNSKSLFRAVAGIRVIDAQLYVVDRLKGVFVFRLPDKG